MKKHLAALTALLMAISFAACSNDQAENTGSENVSESVSSETSETVSESASETSAEPAPAETEESPVSADSSDFSYVGKWYFIRSDMNAEGMSLSMSLKDMEVTELTPENSFVLDIKDGGVVDINAYGEEATAEWAAAGSGIAITGDEEALGADRLEFTAEDTDLIKTALAFEGESMDMYFAKEGSPKIEESLNNSLFEIAFSELLGAMIKENMTELTADTPAVLTYDEDTEAMYCGFIAPEAGSYTFRSESSGHDTASVYDPSSFSETIASSDNTEGGFEVTMELEAEQEIYIEVISDSKEVTVTAQKN